MKHADLKKKALQRPGVKTEYEALNAEFELLRQMLSASPLLLFYIACKKTIK